MRRLKLVWRLLSIQFVLIRHGLDELIFSIHLLRPLYFLSWLNPYNWFRHPEQTRGERLRKSLEDLGPLFVKFGQMLSTRRDILPHDITRELAKLQDKVPPFVGARAVIERALKGTIEEKFACFDEQAMASASIAQVHAATLHDGSEVVIKVLRPGIEKRIRGDIELMMAIAELIRRFAPGAKRFKPVEVVAEFERHLAKEVDLMYEAANASQLRRNFLCADDLYIPKVYWDYASSNVLVFERIYGIPIQDTAALRRAGVNMKALAEIGVTIFFTQVFRDCFFHADMHPGNLFVDATQPDKPRVIAVDFGIVGTLTPSDQRYLAENMLAFFNRDYRRVAQLHVESNWVSQNTPVNEFESAIRTVCEPIFERPIKDISIGRLLMRLFQTAREFQMPVQPQLMLLQKTLISVEGLGRELYADLDLWQTGKPFLERWLRSQMGARAALRKSCEFMPYWLEKLPDMPEMMYQSLRAIRQQPQKTPTELAGATTANTATALKPTVVRFAGGLVLGILGAWLWLSPDKWLFLEQVGIDFWWGCLTGALGVSLLISKRQK